MLQCVTIVIKSFRFCLYTHHNAKRIQSPTTKHIVSFMKKTLSIAQWSHVTGENFNTSATHRPTLGRCWVWSYQHLLQLQQPTLVLQAATTTTDDIELRLCIDESLTDEDIAIETIELYVQ